MKRTYYCPKNKNRNKKQIRYVDNPIKRLSQIEEYRNQKQKLKGFRAFSASGNNVIELFDDMIA